MSSCSVLFRSRNGLKGFLGVDIADPKDIGAMKIAAVMDRGFKKDFIDLYYFVDAEYSEMPVMLEKVSWKEVKSFFEKEAVRLGKKYL